MKKLKHKPTKQSKFFKVTENKIERTRKHCPRCGEGVILSEHKDRFYCGLCHYTEFKKTKE
jgi:small subunit ribosomal protein S27Ae